MAKKNKINLDYRRAKKILNRYHKFSFNTPRKGKDFTPQQKAAITRQMNKLKDQLKKLDSGDYVFIPGKKLEDGVTTNKGTILHYPKATIKKKKKYKTYKVTPIFTSFGKRREIYLQFPKRVARSLELIEKFVDHFKKIYKPDYTRWAVKNMKTSHVYDPSVYKLYLSKAIGGKDFFKESIKGKDAVVYNDSPYYIGVYMGFDPTVY